MSSAVLVHTNGFGFWFPVLDPFADIVLQCDDALVHSVADELLGE